MTFKLRPYQDQAVEAIRHDWQTYSDELAVMATGLGKSQPVDARILTPTGWTRMGDVALGEQVIGSDGRGHVVTGIFPQGMLDVYRMTFSDGSEVECSADHLWTVNTKSRNSRGHPWQVKPLSELIGDVRDGSGAHKWFIPVIAPVEFEPSPILIDPYLLGALLGDGCMSPKKGGLMFSSADDFIVEKIGNIVCASADVIHVGNADYKIVHHRKTGVGGTPLNNALKFIGVWGQYAHEKHIPSIYKHNSIAVRLAVLQGLMDTDGYVLSSARADSAEFNTTSRQLAEDVCEIVRSLGGVTRVRMKAPGKYIYNGEKRTGRVSYRVHVSIPGFNPFTLPRKADRYSERIRRASGTKAIASIELVGQKPCQCIAVNAPDQLYVTDGYTLTHNTAVLLSVLHRDLGPGDRGLILAHRKELIEQPRDRMLDYYPDWQGRIGIVMANQDECDRQITVATVQTLASEQRLQRLLANGVITHLIVDECFPAGTLVDGRPIETLQVGDRVTCYGPTGPLAGRIIETNKRPAAALRVIDFNGGSVTATDNHPFLTLNGWRPADELEPGDLIAVRSDLLRMRPDILTEQIAMEPVAALRAALLREGLLGAGQRANVVSAHGTDESPLRIGAHEGPQPDARPAGSNENGRDLAGNRASAASTWWEWPGADAAATPAGRGARLADGSDLADGNQAAGRGAIALQAGHCEPNAQGSSRGGRLLAYEPGAAGAGRAEGCLLAWARVDAVSVYEPDRAGGFGRLCPDGYVYNLAVGPYPNYTANGVIVHNCHHATADTYVNIWRTLRDYNPKLKHLGVTATPLRSDGAGLRAVYQHVSYKMGIKEGVQQGWLVPPRWLAIQTGISLAGVPKNGGDYTQRKLADVYDTANCHQLVVESHQKYASGRQALAFTASVDGAYDLAAAFNAAGIAAAAADANTPKPERANILRAFRNGEIAVLCNRFLYTEGLDVPEVSCIHMVAPTLSDLVYTQKMGRGLRPVPGKTDALILDYAPLEARNIVMAGDVLGVEARKDAYIKDDEQEGAVLGGFTFDGKFKWLKGDPMEIVSRQLDYLDLSPWVWDRDKSGWLILPLGAAEDGVDRTLAMSPVADSMTLYLIAKRADERYPTPYEIKTGSFEELSAWADEYAERRGQAILAAKARQWRKAPPTDKQIAYAQRLRVFEPGMSRGQVAAAITRSLTMRTLKSAGYVEAR